MCFNVNKREFFLLVNLYLYNMKKILRIKESDFKSSLKRLLEQNQEEEWIKISPEEYLDLLKLTSYYSGPITKFPKFRGKKIWITGNLNVSNLPIKSLEGINYIEGYLDISNTDISNISHIQSRGYTRDWNSGVSRIREIKIRNQKLSDAKDRREQRDFELEANTEESNCARALFDDLIYNENLDEDEYLDDEGENRLLQLYTILDNLNDKRQEYEEQGLDTDEIDTDEESTQDEIDELESRFSIYHLIPSGEHYELTRFEIIGYGDFEGMEYAVGDYEDAERSAIKSISNLIDDTGIDNYPEWVIENSIDSDKVEDYARSLYDDDVRESPDSYFNESDYELSSEQEEEKERLEAQLAELEEKQNNLEHEIEEPEDYSKAYDEVQEQIDEIESMIEDIEPNEPSEEQIEDKIEELVDQALRDPISWLKDFGYSLKDFVDEDEMVKNIFDTDGLETLAHYDGSYDTQNVNGTEFYIFRLD